MGDFEVMLFFLAGVFIVFIIALLSIVRMSTNRTTAASIDDLKEEMKNLKQRINELENEKM
ncbi:lipopolysaccharide assembly protein LapA domain-containing protein [Sporosarcina jiandibaonis]|uniref:lipopolysaccharide assembly protein LapA domain-containing protein n=1 Tax=Sporosarcina jiandibaonis TaxID=2715535 RepID=UPI001552B825|nr:lipopolysaccharide assembly protein LapA domain-containing protein [Sporosarcina jiandibaonis]